MSRTYTIAVFLVCQAGFASVSLAGASGVNSPCEEAQLGMLVTNTGGSDSVKLTSNPKIFGLPIDFCQMDPAKISPQFLGIIKQAGELNKRIEEFLGISLKKALPDGVRIVLESTPLG